MCRRFLTSRRIRSLFWDFLTPAATLYLSFATYNTHPILSKIFAACALFDAFITGIKIGYIYHKWYIRSQDDYESPTSHD